MDEEILRSLVLEHNYCDLGRFFERRKLFRNKLVEGVILDVLYPGLLILLHSLDIGPEVVGHEDFHHLCVISLF
jgi:hypothetical protein